MISEPKNPAPKRAIIATRIWVSILSHARNIFVNILYILRLLLLSKKQPIATAQTSIR